MSKITFIIGGARSGKSSFAARLAGHGNKKTAFIATCQPLDAEMKQRIRLHRAARPLDWKTYEEPCDLALLLAKTRDKFDCIIIDCLTLWVSNLLLGGASTKDIEKQIERVLSALKPGKGRVFVVSNEVGLGVVPPNKLARDFRDAAGRVNQIVAKQADEVLFMAAGLPLKLK